MTGEAHDMRAKNASAIARIPVQVKVVLGSVRMSVREIAALEQGAVLKLDRRIGEPVDILVNGRLVARGEMAVVEEGEPRFAVSIAELVDAGTGEQGDP